ncbi:MAG: HD domain-containing phosphohydrolase, partial [Vulcanimicrobiaceae bacterium]
EGFGTLIEKRARKMTLFTAQGANSSPDPGALADLLTFFGAVADVAAGERAGTTARVAALATTMATLAEFGEAERHALHWAAILRNAGAFGNKALRKDERLPERAAAMLRWDIPPAGARICEQIGALPKDTADLVRWQSEAWDGTGFPDQLRWHGIPKAAQMLHIARFYVAFEGEPEEALAATVAASGQRFAPEQTRIFVRWFHTYGGEIAPLGPPLDSLAAENTRQHELIELIADRVDEHTGAPGRWRRIGRRAETLASFLRLSDDDARHVALAAALFGTGEIGSAAPETQAIDPLSRFAIEESARSAVAAARLVETSGTLKKLAPVLRARAEWYDGTGRPDGLRHEAIPAAAHVLATCIAYDTLDELGRTHITGARRLPLDRLETAAGTQFDPRLVAALTEVVKTHA